MKKKMIIGSIFAVFLMMMLPLTSAKESEIAEDDSKLLQMYFEKFNECIDNDSPAEPTCILLFRLLFRWGMVAIAALLVYILIN